MKETIQKVILILYSCRVISTLALTPHLYMEHMESKATTTITFVIDFNKLYYLTRVVFFVLFIFFSICFSFLKICIRFFFIFLYVFSLSIWISSVHRDYFSVCPVFFPSFFFLGFYPIIMIVVSYFYPISLVTTYSEFLRWFIGCVGIFFQSSVVFSLWFTLHTKHPHVNSEHNIPPQRRMVHSRLLLENAICQRWLHLQLSWHTLHMALELIPPKLQS